MPLPRSLADHFADRQTLTVTVFNGDRIIRYLQVTRRFRWIGGGVGTALAVAVVAHDGSLSPYFPITGWFLGGVAAEFVFTRFRPRMRRPHGMCLSSSLLVGIWRFSAALSAAVAVSTVVRSFRMDVGVAERGWAVLALGVVLAVHLLLRHLNGTPVPQGPADLVTAELAIRSRSARTLMAGGTAVTLWTASRCGLPELPAVLRGSPELLAAALPIFAWLLAAIPPWQVTAATRRRFAAALPAVLALLMCAGLLIRWESPDSAPGTDDRTWLATGPLVRPLSRPVESARRRPEADAWELLFGPYDGVVLAEAEALLPGRRPQGRPAPLALSGDGHHVAYLDRRSRRVVALELTTLRRVHLTPPLADAAVPGVALSADGSHAVLTSGTGSELVDTRTGSRAVLGGVRRVLGIGPGGVTVGTTGGEALPGSPDTALLTLDAGGRELARVPFDPTLKARLSPDGRTLAVVSPTEVVTMDPGTGRVRGRAPLDLPGVERDPDVVGWSASGHLLVRSGPSGLDEAVHHLVDPATGRARPVKDLTGSVLGRLS
ncbi:hypothetical protein [Nonomuraea indica]|uniref:WD40 repeat domain-containing protein n=1 Tax=Nonomuraea indica TaxID=1581193 RepID=A0ABW8A2Y9_9ACTN